MKQPNGVTFAGPQVDVERPERSAAVRLASSGLMPYPGDDQAAEVARLGALGATGVDVGQGDVSWTCLADPEGNEFCVLTPG
ncbi:hypothetical protein M2302_003229 [Micromonospora sp. A200]|uniref:VOC family protein n=1 Tax=Micromonospora sp. A200 TaxID=2940568 RepID=UPI00247DA3DF|nr:hypothetical protein [Micromonospora sp. A200]